ncbi:phospholipid-transporting ATPase ABCA3-like isoform X2 [Dermacentor andersoni]|uniref:phospholipid-transporting ATPase ABCA3-like isoform X2 n=1 Tax=Dermacentor andersoni TaxID=34620 RepID=UPI00241601F0|nr:phospholipid-transporting ATPase ABCA3-like isoform X2 [Dermacentor andersoni]
MQLGPSGGDYASRAGARSMRTVPLLWCRQLFVILWKNVYLKRICRHYVLTVIEVVFMVAMLLGIQEDSVVREPHVQRGATVYSPIGYRAFWNTQGDLARINTVYFAPSSNYLSALTRAAFADLGVHKVVEVPTEQQLLERVRTDANKSLPATSVALLYVNHVGVDDTLPVSLHVTLFAGRLPFDLQVLYQQRLISQPEGPVAEERYPEMNTLLPVMGALQQRHLQLQAERFGYQHPLEEVTLNRFPFPSHLEYKDTKNYALVLTRFCIGILVPFSLFVARLVEEKASGMKEMLRLMGLSDWVYWLSHYLSGFFMHLITVTLMMLFVSVNRNEQGRAFIQFSDPMLLFTILMCFCSNCQMHAILLSMFFSSSQYAVAGAMIYWTFSCVMPFLTLEQADGEGYYYIQRHHKLYTSIFPGMSLHWSFRVLERFEKFVHNGANWGNFYDRAATPDNITLAEILFVGLLCDCTIIVLVWYLDNVLPVGPGITKPFLFPFDRSYWLPSLSVIERATKPAKDTQNFEDEPKDQLAAIVVSNLCKDYDGVVAVQGVDLRIFENQITVLLGHNGAGKTTLLNMITGFLGCTSGVVRVGGYDVRTSTRDARDSIGYCPQENILIDDLTVEEHLMYFAIIKGIPMNRTRLETVTLLYDVGLMEYRTMLASELAPGLQRRLCTAMAILAMPKVIIMDEPTSNMDPDGRREMWELLLKIRRSCSIFLTTQHLDEADVLGDRIVIMANGQIRCGGSPMFLKQRFGTGYHMKVHKLRRCNVRAVQDLLRNYAPKARLQSDSDNEAVFILGQIISTRKTAAMFMDIEQRSADLGIASVGLTVTSLEDVLVSVGEDQHVHGKLTTVDNEDSLAIDANMPMVRTLASPRAIEPSLLGCVWAVVLKRATYVWRQKKVPLFSWMLPPLLLSLLFFLEYVSLRGSGHNVEHVGDTVSYTFPEVMGQAQGFFVVDKDEAFNEQWLHPLVLNPEQFYIENLDPETDITESLLSVAKEMLRKYVFNIHFGVQMTQKAGNVLWYNGQIQHAAPLVLRLYNTARLRNVTKMATAEFRFDVTSRGSEDVNVTEGGRRDHAYSAASGGSEYRTVLPKVLRSIFFPLVSSLMCSNFVIFPTSERALGVKHLHMIAGMSPLLYWLTNFAFDFMFYMGTAMIVLLPLPLVPYTTLDAEDYKLIFVLNLLHGYAALPVVYISSFLYGDPGSAYSTLVIVKFIMSSAGCLGSVFLEHHFVDDASSSALATILHGALQILRLLPTYSYSRGMTKIMQLARENGLCRAGGMLLESRCQTKENHARLSLMRCCMHMDSPDPSEYMIHPLDVHPYSAFYEFLTLSVEGLALFVLLLCLESWLRRLDRSFSSPDPSAYHEGAMLRKRSTGGIAQGLALEKKEGDMDVVLENQLVAVLAKSDLLATSSRPFMIVNRLYKAYGYIESVPVLQGLTFTVRAGECFGLLGVNGAGKTTTFRLLTGEILPHHGDAVISNFSIVRERQKCWRYIGYCPQRDGLLDMLTGVETLRLFGRLRGVPMTREYLRVLLYVFRLQEIADYLVGTYSAGNRRKLSICISMIGLPRILLLDEPYATISTTARKRIVNYISALQRVSKMSILLSSHCLSDVEFLCNRIAIMDSGKLQCLGTLGQLKEKFGKGYTITVKTYPDKKQDFSYQQDVVSEVCKVFPEAEMAYSYEGLLEFRMSRVDMLWSEMFMRMARIKRRHKLQDFFIADASLEQIFLSVTRKEASEAAAAAAVVQSPSAVPPIMANPLGL